MLNRLFYEEQVRQNLFAITNHLISHISLPTSSVRSFGDTFSPGTFSAQRHSTSELLRTL